MTLVFSRATYVNSNTASGDIALIRVYDTKLGRAGHYSADKHLFGV